MIDEAALTAAMELMDLRRGYVLKHSDMMFAMFESWKRANELDWPEAWEGVLGQVAEIVEFISSNPNMFPNKVRHLEQYGLLAEVAALRRLASGR